jgi:hypothetical protein
LARYKQQRLKRRTREHVIADLSVNHVERHVLLCGHIVERRTRDYGIDLMMQTFDASGEVEPGLVLLQLKATDHLKVVSAGRLIAERLERRDLLAWLKEPMPVILVVYDAQADKAYWLHIQGGFAHFWPPAHFCGRLHKKGDMSVDNREKPTELVDDVTNNLHLQ